MAKFEHALATLSAYRVALQAATFQEVSDGASSTPTAQAFAAAVIARGGAISSLSTPLTNVHATGVGVRLKDGKIIDDEFVLKAYVFQKLDLGADTPDITRRFEGVEVDVEALPVQWAAARKKTPQAATSATVQPAAAGAANRARTRPIVGGVSISPLNARYVGTLGCFVRGVSAGAVQIFALSNNHVLVDVNNLPIGTSIVQPGPETGVTQAGDVFANLSNFVPIGFSTTRFQRVVNYFDAAVARVSDPTLVQTGQMLGIPNYQSILKAPLPGMSVTKSGRTTGVTQGMITAIHVNSLQVNYGTQGTPRIALYDDVIQIQGNDGQPFSLPGDSGSVILEATTGQPMALLFAGDGQSTSACDLAGVCRRFQVVPI